MRNEDYLDNRPDEYEQSNDGRASDRTTCPSCQGTLRSGRCGWTCPTCGTGADCGC
jgi:hypothetical protein